MTRVREATTKGATATTNNETRREELGTNTVGILPVRRGTKTLASSYVGARRTI
jgi:hypothetical protein